MNETAEAVYEDIARVAHDLSVPIGKLTRRVYTQNGTLGWLFERFGPWSQVKAMAADYAGTAPHVRDLAETARHKAKTSYTRKLERDLGLQRLVWDELHSHVVMAIQSTPLRLHARPRPKAKEQKPRALVALLSDLHFGAVVGEETLGNEFNADVARDRMRKLSDQVRTWKEHRRDITDLVVCFAGDILEGTIHMDDGNVEPIVKQWNDARVIITEFLDEVVAEYRSVRIICLPGNHDRVTKQRALAMRWNSHAHTLFEALKATFRGYEQITWDVPRSGIGQYHTPGGELIVFNHGDVGMTVKGNVSASIPTGKLVAMIEKWEASGVFDRPIAAACMGHFHTPLTLTLGTKANCELVINGSLKGSDAFTFNGMSIPGSPACQIIFESTADHAVGDVRKCMLS